MKPILSLVPLVLICVTSFSQNLTYSEEEVSFQNGEVVLNGTLIISTQKEKTPAIVFLHGSGPHSRAGFRKYAEVFAKLGFSSLFFDKRGSGSSGGSWITSSLNDLAQDAVVALEYLKGRDEIDASQIGFWGISQAGWVAPLAASMTPDVAFMVLVSGGGASPYESEMHSYKEWFTAASFSQSEFEEGVNLIERYMLFLATGDKRGELVNTLDTISNENLRQVSKALGHILPSDKNRMNWEWVANYDPAEDIGRLDIPVLILTGDKDNNHPAELASEKWKHAFSDNPELLTIMVFPGAGHGIRMGGGHNERGAFADGYWETQIGWLWKNVIQE